jgi:medium-chain acyl-[acyl-carrier-protein] hydrolase
MNQHPSLWEQELRVDAYECDFNQCWKPASFFQHLTEIAGVHATQLGFGYQAMLDKNFYWVLSRMKIQFHAYPHNGEIIRVRTWPKTIQQKLFFIRDFEVETSSGEPLASASSAWLVINTQSRRMVPSSTIDLALPNLPERSALAEPLDKIIIPETTEERLQALASYSTVDVQGHVNNGRYVEWICDSFDLETFKQQRPAWMQVNYNSEVLPGERVSMRSAVSAEDTEPWLLEGVNLASGVRAFEAQVKWKRCE